MSNIFRILATLGSLVLPATSATIITTGQAESTFANPGNIVSMNSTISLSGFNFSLSGSSATNQLAVAFCCSYDFSQTWTSTGSTSPSSITVGPTTYSAGSYTLSLTLNFVSSVATLPQLLPTPFTATGSYTVMNGATIVAADTLSGSGSATAIGGGGLSHVVYTFNAPEPASVFLLGAGLLSVVVLRIRRRRA